MSQGQDETLDEQLAGAPLGSSTEKVFRQTNPSSRGGAQAGLREENYFGLLWDLRFRKTAEGVSGGPGAAPLIWAAPGLQQVVQLQAA